MLTSDEKLRRAAMTFGAWRERANKSKRLSDRLKLVHAETALAITAQKFYEDIKRGLLRGNKRRNKS